MSIGDTVFIFFLALIFFGPKKLPELARQLGKLVAEFRRASNEFRFQMEEELRMAEQADAQKRMAALQTAEPGDTTTAIAAGTELSIMPPATGLPVGAATEGGFDSSYGTEIGDTDTGIGDTAIAPESAAQPSHTEPPVEQEPSHLSATLGPPSQSDAVEMPSPAAEALPAAEASFAPDFHEDRHNSSNPVASEPVPVVEHDLNVPDTQGREFGMPHEVHTANG